MLKLKSLKISNVGRFVGSHVVNFSERPFLIQVDAQNNNTGGSSGAGKSTIFNSLEYLLGISYIPSTVLQSRLTKEAMSVTGEFDLDGKSLTIIRSKSGGLSIQLDGIDIVSGNTKAAEEKLDSILVIPRELLRKMIHKRQKEGGFFLSLTPKECHNFLIEALDLKLWSKRADKVDEDQKYWSLEFSKLTAELDSLEKSLNSLKESLSRLERPALNWSPEILLTMENLLSKHIEAEQSLSLKFKEEIAKIEQPLPPDTQDRSALKPLQDVLQSLKAQESFERNLGMENLSKEVAELQSYEVKLSNGLRLIEASNVYQRQLDEIKTKIISIKEGTCPTCRQAWTEGQDEINSVALKAKTLVMEIEKANSFLSEKSILENIIAEKRSHIVKVKEEISKSKLAPRILAAETALNLEAQKLDREAFLKNQAYQEAVASVRSLENNLRSKFEDEIAPVRYNIQETSKLLTQNMS